MPIVITIITVIILVVLYVGTGMLNDKVGVPKGCEKAYLEAQECETCSASGSASCHSNDGKFQDALEFMKEVKL